MWNIHYQFCDYSGLGKRFRFVVSGSTVRLKWCFLVCAFLRLLLLVTTADPSRPVTLLHYSYSAPEGLNSEGSRANSTALFHRRLNRLRETWFVQSLEW